MEVCINLSGMEWGGDELAREIERTCIVVDEYVFEKNGWLLRGIVFET